MASAIGVVSPGAMGAAVGAALVAAGHDVRWASEGRSEGSRRRAERAGLTDARTLSALAEVAQLVLSIVPPQAAVATARSLRGFRGVYVDANAIAPGTAREVAAALAGATYVDGGIIGPPPERPGTTRLYLSGTAAATVAERFAGTAVDARIVSPDPTAASALKMAYAAWTKGSAALLLAVEAAAGRLGVQAQLEAEWALSRPELPERLRLAAAARAANGWRWGPEMEEVARTFADAGLPGGFHAAAAEVFRRAP